MNIEKWGWYSHHKLTRRNISVVSSRNFIPLWDKPYFQMKKCFNQFFPFSLQETTKKTWHFQRILPSLISNPGNPSEFRLQCYLPRNPLSVLIIIYLVLKFICRDNLSFHFYDRKPLVEQTKTDARDARLNMSYVSSVIAVRGLIKRQIRSQCFVCH